jgi:hypothetical protein
MSTAEATSSNEATEPYVLRGDSYTQPQQLENCGQCGKSLMDSMWVETFSVKQGGESERIKIICIQCSDANRMNDYQVSGLLSTNLIMEAQSHKFYREEAPHSIVNLRKEYMQRYRLPLSDAERSILAEQIVLESCYKRFERKVWFEGGVQKYIIAAKKRGHRAEFGGFTCLMCAMAGRVMFTFNDAEGMNVTVIADETSPTGRMGLQSIYATCAQAVSMVDAFTDNWAQVGKFSVDTKVGF